MEAGGHEVGHIFTRLDAKLDEKNFRRYDAAVERSRGKTRDFARDQDKLRRSTETLGREQQRHVKFLRSQGHSWASVAQQVGVSEDALKSYNTTTRTTVREQEKVRRSNRDTERSFFGLDGAIAKVNRGASFFSRTLRLLKWPALIVGAGAALQGVNALSAGVVALVSALSPLSGLLVALPASLGTFGQTLGVIALSVMGVKDAVKSLSDAQVKSGATAEDTASRQRSAARQIRSADEQVRSAEEQLSDAQVNSKDSQHELNDARREAVDTLQEMRDAAINARIDERGAQLALRRAIADLWKAQEDPSSSFLDLEELELRVRESRQELKEARRDNKEAQAENRRTQKGGIRKDPGVLAAERSRAEAKRDVARAEEDIVRAERDATEARQDAAESLNQTSAAVTKVEESFSKLTPEAARFSRFLFGMKPELEGLQKTASKGFLPGAETGIKSAMRNLPVVNRIIGGTSRVLGNLSERAGKFFGSRGFGDDLERIGKGNARTLGFMGRGLEHLTKGLTNTLVVAQPFLRFLGRYTNHLTSWIEKSTEVNRKNGDMARFFGRTRQVVQRLTSTFQSLGSFLHVVGEESAPLGRQILKVFDQGAESLERWAESTSGRNSIAQYFEDARGPLWEAGRLVRDIVEAFFEIGDGEGMDAIEELIRQVRVELLPVFTDVTKETTAAFGPHLIELLTQVLGLFGRLAGGSGPLTLYVDALSAAAKATNFLLDTVPGLREFATAYLAIGAVVKTTKWTGAFTGLEKAFEWALGTRLGNKVKTRALTVVKTALARGAFAANYAAEWGMEIGARAAGGIGKQIGKFKAVARRAAIAFIGIFVPEVAAAMAAGGRLGDALNARFPRLGKFFGKWGGKMGIAFAAAAITFGILELTSDKQKAGIMNAGATIGEWFVNALIDVVEKGYDTLRDMFNNTVGLLPGVPSLPEWDPGVSWTEWNDPPVGPKGRKEARERTPPKQRRRERRQSNRESEALSMQEKRENYELLWGVPPPPGPGPWPPPKKFRDPDNRRQSRRGGNEELSLELGGDGDRTRRRRGGRGPEDEAKDTKKRVTDEHKKMRRDVEGETARLQRNVLDRFGKIRKGAGDESKRLGKTVTGSVQDMRGAHDRGTAAMLSTTDTRFEGMRTIVSSRSSSMREDLAGNVGEMNATTSAGMDQIQGAVVKALKAFGVKDVNLDLKGGPGKKDRPRKAAEGGVFTIPGEGLQDTVYLPGVHAMVAPGEDLFVANRHQQPLLDYAVANTFGVGGLDEFFSTFNRPHYLAGGGRAGPRRHAGGGMVDVPSDPDHATDPNDSVASSIVGAVDRWVRRYHANITAAFDPGGGHVSAGHNVTGTATDLVPAAGWTPSATRLFEQGLHFLVTKGFEVGYDGRVGTQAWADHGRGNHAHVEWLGQGTAEDAIASLGGMAGLQRIKGFKVAGTDGTEKTLVQAALDRTVAGANSFLGRKTGMGRREGSEFGVAVPTGPIKKMARQMVLGKWGPGEWPPFVSLEEAEAGWNPYATNPSSGAYGLPQALPPSKLPAGAQPGSKLPKLEHAKLQLQWMMSYIQERYGAPSAAWAFHQSNNWYARGGRALRRFAGGGSFKGNINRRYTPHWAPDYSGTTLPSYVVAALAEAAGAPGRTMEQVTRGESGSHRKNTARPGSAGVDKGGSKGYGMWAITWPYANSIVRKYGGYPEMWNPVKNAGAMKEVLVTNGLGAWYGDGAVTGSNLHYTGKYDIRNALGGMSYKEALAGRKQPGKESMQAERQAKRAKQRGPKKKKSGRRAGLDKNAFLAEPPKGKYNPRALLQLVAETGIGLPYALLMNGAPNWRGLTANRYNELVNQYYEQVTEYRKNLGEERQQAEESWRPNQTRPGVTKLSEEQIADAMRFHSPIGGEIAAYRTGYGALGALDQRAEGTRSAYLNTYSESYLRPYKEKETFAEYTRTGTLASIDPAAEKKAFAEAKLKGLRKRLKRFREGKKKGPKAQAAVAAAEIAKGRKRSRRAGRRFARGGRVPRLAKGGKGKTAVGKARNAALPSTPAGVRKKTRAQIKRHNRKVDQSAERRRQRAEERYEEETEGVLDPVEREREELEEREAYEGARREELGGLLSEVAANAQRTALVGRVQSPLFDTSTFFARGGTIPPAAAPPPAPVISSSPRVTVPLSLRLAGAMEALNPHIEAIVDGRVHRLGRGVGESRATVSSVGRKVSYRGK